MDRRKPLAGVKAPSISTAQGWFVNRLKQAGINTNTLIIREITIIFFILAEPIGAYTAAATREKISHT
jgi:hypothetical protein